MIRRAAPSDMAQLVVLCRDHAAYERAPYVEDGQSTRLARALFEVNPPLHAWVVDAGGVELLGYMTAVLEFATWPARPFVYMDTLYLRERARRQGWGRQLMESLSDFAQGLGVHELQWQTPPWNEEGVKFYQRIGAGATEKLRFALELR